jgi:hypothetical protein
MTILAVCTLAGLLLADTPAKPAGEPEPAGAATLGSTNSSRA